MKAEPENKKGKVAKEGVVVNYFYTETVEERVVYKVITEWIDVNGKQLKPSEEGEHDKGKIPNYVFLETIKTRHKITHVFMAGEPIVEPKPFFPGEIPTPSTPEIPNPQPNPAQPQPEPEKPQPEPEKPQPEPEKPKKTEEPCKPELPNTGTETNAGVTVLGVLSALSGIGLLTRKKEEDEN